MKLLITNSYGKLTRTAITERLKLIIHYLLSGNDPSNSQTRYELKIHKEKLKELDSQKVSTFLLFGLAIDPQSNNEKISINDVFNSKEINELTKEINKYIKNGRGSTELSHFIDNFVLNAQITPVLATQATLFNRINLPKKTEDNVALALIGLAFILGLANRPTQALGVLIAASFIWKFNDLKEAALDTIEQRLLKKH